MTTYTFIRRDILGRILEERTTYPGSTFGWFRLCQTTGAETRLA